MLWSEQEAVIALYRELGLKYHVDTFDRVGWRGAFTYDPDCNTVEIVSVDPSGTSRTVSLSGSRKGQGKKSK
jgi:hypothetical protein